MSNRDVIAIGASMGGIDALSRLIERLPADLPAAILVVQHTSDRSPGLLSQILEARGQLPAITVQEAMPLTAGRIFVAPPNRHLVVTAEGIDVVFGARENRTRPAIDPLFRTAAVHCRSRVIGVVLTGLMGDGASGLRAIHRCGGAAVVQAPTDALHPEMPLNALQSVRNAISASIEEMPGLLTRLTAEEAPRPPPVPEILKIEASFTERGMTNEIWNQIPGRSTDFTCPDCRGALREFDEEGIPRFRCRVGHAYDTIPLDAAGADRLEEALWVALQTLKERVQLLDTIAREERGRGHERAANGYDERRWEMERHTRVLSDVLRELGSNRATAAASPPAA